MCKKIIVAGGGHGGIATASLLSQKGFDVTVYEKNTRENIGYDWTDIFDPKAFNVAGIPMPSENLYELKTDMTFYTPAGNTPIRQRVPDDKAEIKMERKDIYNHLITHAENNGVKFVFDCSVYGPICKAETVVGIKTSQGDFYGDLVIDACGCESPVRAGLPSRFGIQKHPSVNEKFYVYRAFYNRGICDDVEDKYKVCLLPEGILGIGWIATEEEYTDLLIGRFKPFGIEEVNRTADYYRQTNPSLGTKLVRGGQFVEIPVRQTLALMVANGYAAIGDSAFMTVPIIGSGIANSLRAAPILAEVVANNSDKGYTAEVLWDYQVAYYKKLGAGLSPLALVKLLLTKITPEQLDYLFDKQIITWREMTITADTTSIFDFIHIAPDMPKRGLLITKDKDLMKKLLKVAEDISKLMVINSTIPVKYNKAKVMNWARKYNKCFYV